MFDFKQCSACKAVVYCSAEHAALHWRATHGKECASLKTAGVKPRSTADEGEGAAGGPGNDLEQPSKAELTRALDRPVLQNAVRARGAFDEGDDEKKVGETTERGGGSRKARPPLLRAPVLRQADDKRVRFQAMLGVQGGRVLQRGARGAALDAGPQKEVRCTQSGGG